MNSRRMNYVWDLKDQYMYGPDLLVAPILYEGAVSREVYLPEGSKWTDARTGRYLRRWTNHSC